MKPSPGLRLVPLEKASGATCNAYMARFLGKKVFVKEIKPEFADNARMIAAFRKESEIGFRLDHPNLPRYIYAEGILPLERYIVQEFIDGQTLPDFIKENPLFFQNQKNVERFLRDLIDVVDYLHHNQIIHLDLKPENILISRVGTSLKLVDLGFCASDFYDDTRGFTLGELAPEGITKPEDRGAESDYYGVGKILKYLRTHTPRFPKKRYQKLEAAFLLQDPTKRIASKEDFEKCLGGSVGKSKVWITAVFSLIVSATVIFLFLFNVPREERNVTSGKTEDTLLSHDDKEPVTNIRTLEGNPIEGVAEKGSMEQTAVGAPQETHPETSTPLPSKKENITAQKQESFTPKHGDFSLESYEKLKAEMAENIHKNFAGFEKMLNSYIREGKFTEKDYKAVTDAFNAALHETFITTSYKAKYQDLSPSTIDNTMAEVLQEIEKANWGPNLKKYIKQYQASLSGPSK